jgi:hypothetical protein
MKLIELFPLIEWPKVNVYEKRKYMPSIFIASVNPKKNKECISNDLLDREIYSISISYNREFNIYVRNKKDDEELIKKAASIGLIEDVNNDNSNEDVEV